MANNQDKNDEYEASVSEASTQKQVLHTGITGKVKWFNVKRGYGFVCRDDNHEDIFIHQSAIVKSNPEHPRKSVGEGEDILFDIVKGAKGNEAANVSASDGNCVKGSQYALRYPRGRGRGRGTFRGKPSYRGRGAPGGISDEGEMRTQEFFRGTRGRPFRGNRFYDTYRKPYNYEMPPGYFYEFDYYRGQMRPPRGGFRGRGFRGGPPRDVPMKFESNEYFERRPQSRGRGDRGRGRRRGRGRGMSRDNVKANEKEEEEHHESDQCPGE